MAADEGEPRGWGEQFPRVTNDEYLALARARLSSLQYGIVLFLITQTRGTGRMQSGELSGYDDFDEARDHFGCESRHLFRAQVAGRLGRHPNAVARELRRLIAAGIVVELEPAQKGQAAELAVVLDERRWRLERARRAQGCANRCANGSANGSANPSHQGHGERTGSGKGRIGEPFRSPFAGNREPAGSLIGRMREPAGSPLKRPRSEKS